MDEQEQMNQEQMPEQNSNVDVQQAMRGVEQLGSGASNLAKKGLSHISPGGMGKKGTPSKYNNKGNSIAKKDNKPLGTPTGGKLPGATSGGSKLAGNKSLGDKTQSLGGSPVDKLKSAIGNRGSKGGQGSGVGNAAKKLGGKAAEGVKTQTKALAREGARKLLMKLLASPAGPYILAIAGGILLLIIIILILMLVILSTDSSAAGAGSGSYSYTGDTTDHLTFMCTMNSPLPNPTESCSCYGWRSFSQNFHNGIDLSAGIDTEIYAVHSGTISDIGYQPRGLGNYVTVTHDNGYSSTYGHMNKYPQGISIGKKVAQGEVIGYSGNTGNSTGPHLHFILEDETGETFSPDPYFNIGDTGYEACIDRSTGRTDSLAQKCDCPCGKGFNHRTKIDFKEICKNRKSGTNSTGDSTSIIKYITIWEGGPTCNYSGSVEGYKAYDGHDGTITVGPGMTNYAIPGHANIIESMGYQSLFNKTSAGYQLVVGKCYPKDLIDAIVSSDIDGRRQKVTKKAEERGLTLTAYQIDAMVSADYQCPSSVEPALDAYKSGSYSAMWATFKQYVVATIDGKRVSLEGVKKRRKGEFALFVTGDYSDQGLFYSRKLNNYDDYNSEGVMSRIP